MALSSAQMERALVVSLSGWIPGPLVGRRSQALSLKYSEFKEASVLEATPHVLHLRGEK
jgi:hypothetical protein